MTAKILLIVCLFSLLLLLDCRGDDRRESLDGHRPQHHVELHEVANGGIDGQVLLRLERDEGGKAVGQQEGHVQPAEGGGQRRGLEPPAERRLAQGGQELREREYNSFLCNE